MAVLASTISAATGRPSESTATTYGTTLERSERTIMPAVWINAIKEHKIAISRQFFARVIRFPYRSSHSRRAMRYGFVNGAEIFSHVLEPSTFVWDFARLATSTPISTINDL